jgi:hypothetical protein
MTKMAEVLHLMEEYWKKWMVNPASIMEEYEEINFLNIWYVVCGRARVRRGPNYMELYVLSLHSHHNLLRNCTHNIIILMALHLTTARIDMNDVSSGHRWGNVRRIQ